MNLFKSCPTGQHMPAGSIRGETTRLIVSKPKLAMQRCEHHQRPAPGALGPSAGEFSAQNSTCVRGLLAAEGFNIRTFGAKTHRRPNAGPLDDAFLG
jgi:hypothetical protein